MQGSKSISFEKKQKHARFDDWTSPGNHRVKEKMDKHKVLRQEFHKTSEKSRK